MELPYIVEPRKDTGLFNSKLAIWLFLASEVMLFGGLFSGYVFLRIYADFPWPERAIPVLPGLINTVMLILSSVTVVFAWSELKLRNYRKFQVYMGFTLFFAAAFLGFKYVEYTTKFSHQAVKMSDNVVVEGHVDYAALDHGKLVYGKDAKKLHKEGAEKIKAKKIEYKVEEVTFPLRFRMESRKKIINKILKQAKAQDAKLVDESGTEITIDYLKEARKALYDAKKKNAIARRDGLRDAWKVAKAEDAQRIEDGKQAEKSKGWQLAPQVKIDESVLDLANETASITAKFTKPVYLHFGRNDIRESEEFGILRDGTVVKGKQQKSYMDMHIDAVDFQYLAFDAKQKGSDPFEAIEKSWLLSGDHKYAKHFKEYWDKHLEVVLHHNHGLQDRFKVEQNVTTTYKGEKLYLPLREIFRINWQSLIAYDEHYGHEDHGYNKDYSTFNEVEKSRKKNVETFIREYFQAPKRVFPHLKIPSKEVHFESSLTPKWNNFYAIYFTITGLHGLHIIGGMVVLWWFGFNSRKIYDKDPEWLANRVEVGGLFWHFVDLVWIFVFPIFYLM